MFMYSYTVVFSDDTNMSVHSAVDAADIWADSPNAEVYDRDGRKIPEDMLWDLLGKEVR